MLDPLGVGHARDLRNTRRRLVDRDDAVDASVVVRTFELVRLDLLAEVRRDQAVVLDDASIHVDDVECAVRTSTEVDRTEPLVGRSNEVSLRVRIAAYDAAVLRGQDLPLHEVAYRLRNEGVAIELGQQVAAVDPWAARRRELEEPAVAQLAGRLTSARDPRRLVNGPDRFVRRDVDVGALEARIVRIALQ